MEPKFKFRGFHKDPKGKQRVCVNGSVFFGEWISGSLIESPDGDCLIGVSQMHLRGVVSFRTMGPKQGNRTKQYECLGFGNVIRETVGLFSGKRDATGREIYQHDVLAKDSEKEGSQFLLEWDGYSFSAKGFYNGFYDNPTDIFESSEHENDIHVVGTKFFDMQDPVRPDPVGYSATVAEEHATLSLNPYGEDCCPRCESRNVSVILKKVEYEPFDNQPVFWKKPMQIVCLSCGYQYTLRP